MKRFSKGKTAQTRKQGGRRKLERSKRKKTDKPVLSQVKSVGHKSAQEAIIERGKLYQHLFNNSHDAILVSLRKADSTQPDRFILVNDAACQRLGYAREELLQMSPLDISEPLLAIPEMLETLAKNGQVIHEEVHIAKDGRRIPVEISTRVFKLNGKQFNLSIARDISERKQAEETRRLQSAALNAAANAIIITDREGVIQWVNPAWSELTGYSAEEAVGQNPRILKSGVQDEAYYKKLWDTILAGEVWRGELVNKRKDGSLYSEEQTITPVRDALGEITHFVAIKQDITQRKQMEVRLKQMSIHDALTGLYNRGFFEEELARLERRRQFPISIVIADIDRLKETNDRHGHAAGDDLLKRAAQVLSAAFRSEDIIARIGGDEFAVILPNTDAATAETVLLRVRNRLQEHNTMQTGTPISISFGISTSDQLKPLLAALKEADANMYCEKRERYGS
ncbi:MAG: sensor domain-containing diguanylate cyclase [Candidatus Villigracilaceae bacterium]